MIATFYSNRIEVVVDTPRRKSIDNICDEICDELLSGKTKQHHVVNLCEELWGRLEKSKSHQQILKKVPLAMTSILSSFTLTAYASTPANQIRSGFMQVIDVATAIAEPILWFYALTACILIATGRSRSTGWDKLKNVGYAYLLVVMMPTLFAFVRWIATLLKASMKF